MLPATVVRGRQRHDVAVPAGTTVAGLLSQLRVNTLDAGVTVSLVDGRRVEPSAVVGVDLPVGVVLSVAESEAAPLTAEQARAAVAERSWAPLLADLVTVLFVVGGVGLLLGLQGLAGVVVPTWLRLTVPACALVAGLAFAVRHRGGTAGRTSLVPALVALPFAALPDPSGPLAHQLSLVLATTTAAVTGVVQWILCRESASGAAAAVWVGVASGAGLLTFVGAPGPAIAVTLLAAGVLVVALAPLSAMPVPDRQLVDLPLLATTSPQVRTPAVEPPDDITADDVRRLLERGRAVTESLTVSGCVVAVIAAWFVPTGFVPLSWSAAPAPPVGADGLSRVAAVGLAVLLLASIGVLSLAARTHSSRLVRRLPRAAAVTISCALAARVVAETPGHAGTVAVALVVAGIVLIAGTLVVTREPRSALYGRFADLAQAWCVTLLLPATLAAAGVFDLARWILR